METTRHLDPNSIVSQAEQVREQWGDGGCWAEVIMGATQRAGLLGLYPEDVQTAKINSISGVLSRISGHHDKTLARRLCEQLEEIVPLS